MMLVKQNGLGIAGVLGTLLALGVAACGDDFTSEDCRASHTCPVSGGGAAAEGSGDAGSGAMDAGGASSSGDAGSGAAEGPGGSSASGCTAAEQCDNGDPADGQEVCGDDGVCAPGNSPPTVLSVSPEADTVGVEPDATVVIKFSEPLDGATVTAESVRLHDGETVIEGELTYADSQVTFTPAAPLALLADYSVTITTAVTDAEGAPLLDEHASTFTTRDGAWSTVDAASGHIYIFPEVLPIAGNGDVLVSWVPQSTPGVYCPVSARWFNRGEGLGSTTFTQQEGIVECREIASGANAQGVAAVAWTERFEQQYVQQYRAGEWPATVGPAVSSYSNANGGSTSSYAVGVAPSGAVSFLQHRSPSGTYVRRTNANGSWVGAWVDIAEDHAGRSVPRIAFDGEGNGFAAWRAETAGSAGVDEALVARYTAADGWEQAIPLPGSVADSENLNQERGAPAIAVDDAGGAMALWLREDVGTGTGSMVSSRFTAAGGWEAPVVVSGTLALANMPEAPGLVFDGERYMGAFTAADGIVYSAAYEIEAGNWTSYEPRSGDGALKRMPGLGVDAHGNLLLTWLQSGAQPPGALFFARYDARAGEWSDAQAIAGGTVKGSSGMPTAPAVAANGQAALMWVDQDTQGQPAKIRLASFY